jgi:hypothetical protein
MEVRLWPVGSDDETVVGRIPGYFVVMSSFLLQKEERS